MTMPNKGERVIVRGCNGAGQRFEPFEGTVSGIEFRTDPPIFFVVADGQTHEIVNLGFGSEWEYAPDSLAREA